jgi:hypothetical protein
MYVAEVAKQAADAERREAREIAILQARITANAIHNGAVMNAPATRDAAEVNAAATRDAARTNAAAIESAANKRGVTTAIIGQLRTVRD